MPRRRRRPLIRWRRISSGRPWSTAAAKWYADDTKVILPTILPDDSRYPVENKNMEVGGKFLLFHQNYWNWYGMWDYGDVGHMFKPGYGNYIPAQKLLEVLKISPDQRGSYPRIGGTHRRQHPQRRRQRQNPPNPKSSKRTWAQKDYWPQHDWAFDNGRWGWSNTEDLTNLYMQVQYLRTGDRDIYFCAQAAAREARDVIMRHNRDGHWFGAGTRHGVQHWSDGDHEPRQTTNTEFRYDYYLGDDMRSLDWADELTHNFYLKAPINSHNGADHTARLYGLLFAWERSNDPRLAANSQDLRPLPLHARRHRHLHPRRNPLRPPHRSGQRTQRHLFLLPILCRHACLAGVLRTDPRCDPARRDGEIR